MNGKYWVGLRENPIRWPNERGKVVFLVSRSGGKTSPFLKERSYKWPLSWRHKTLPVGVRERGNRPKRRKRGFYRDKKVPSRSENQFNTHGSTSRLPRAKPRNDPKVTKGGGFFAWGGLSATNCKERGKKPLKFLGKEKNKKQSKM